MASDTAKEPVKKAIVFHCGDDRLEDVHRGFLHTHYGKHRYHAIAIPGGGRDLADHAVRSEDAAWCARKIELLSPLFNPPKIVVIFHVDCLAYGCDHGHRNDNQWITRMRSESHKAESFVRKSGFLIEDRRFMGYVVTLSGKVFTAAKQQLVYDHAKRQHIPVPH